MLITPAQSYVFFGAGMELIRFYFSEIVKCCDWQVDIFLKGVGGGPRSSFGFTMRNFAEILGQKER
jgi:hypothetical protein